MSIIMRIFGVERDEMASEKQKITMLNVHNIFSFKTTSDEEQSYPLIKKCRKC